MRNQVERCPASRIPKYGSYKPRDRVLSFAEIGAVWKAAEKAGYPFGWATQLLLLTGQRPSEVVELPWSELVVEGDSLASTITAPTAPAQFAYWQLPADHAKNKIPNLVPLGKRFAAPTLTGQAGILA